jgi:glycosyltransferase involved in cell wall biosynthesis
VKLDYVHSASVELASANAIQVSRMCEAFAGAGADVTLWYPGYAAPDAVAGGAWRAHHGVGDTFAAHRLPAWFPARAMTSRALPAFKVAGYLRLLGRRPDAIYTRCFTAAAFFPRALRARRGGARPPVVFEAHEVPPTRGRARALRGVDAVVAITRAAADDLAGELGFPRDRVLVAPDGVPDAWLDTPIDRAAARARLGLALDRPLAVYTGRFHAGTAPLLRGVAGALAGRLDVVAVGMAAAEARAQVGGVAHLAIHDPVGADAVRDYQAAADVLLMPHAGDVRWARYTSPLKLFEYMAAGRPIVASHLPVLDEVVAHGDTAWLVPVGDAGAIARGVEHVLADAGLGARMVERARAEVRRYTWGARARAILAFVGAIRGAA